VRLDDLSADGSTVLIDTSANGLDTTDDNGRSDVVAIDLDGPRGRTPETGSITGTVVDDDGLPVADAFVRATDPAGARPAMATTGADGSYRIDGLVAGVSYRVWAVDPRNEHLGAFAPSVELGADSPPVTIVEDEVQAGVDIELPDAPGAPPTPVLAPAGPLVANDASALSADPPVVSADGRWIAYEGTAGVYVRDRLGLMPRRLIAPNVSVFGLDISDDGRRLAFVSDSFVTEEETNFQSDAYVADVATGLIERISLSQSDTELTEYTLSVSLSGDGSTVAFVTGTANAGTNVLRIREVDGGQIGTATAVRGQDIAVDATGDHVAWIFDGPGTSGLDHRVMRWDRATGTSQELAPTRSTADIEDISADGDVVLWNATGAGPAFGVPVVADHILAVEASTGEVRPAGVATGGLEAGGHVRSAHIDRTGRYVVFRSEGSTLDPTGPPRDRVWVHDLETRRTTPLPDGYAAEALVRAGTSPALSADGNTVVYVDAQEDIWAVPVPGVRRPSPPAALVEEHDGDDLVVNWTAPLADGGSPVTAIEVRRFEGSSTTASEVVPLPPTATSHRFADLPTASTQRFEIVAENAEGTSSPATAGPYSTAGPTEIAVTVTRLGDPVAGAVATAGTTGATAATSPVAAGTSDAAGHVVLRVPAGSYRVRVQPPSGSTFQIGWSGDGSMAPAGLVEVALGSEVPVDVILGGKGTVAPASTNASGLFHNHPTPLGLLDVSGDGRWVTFSSNSNLTGSSTTSVHTTAQIYLRDMVTGTVHHVTRTAAGNAANGASSLPKVSDDGRYVAFLSAARDWAPGDLNDGTRVDAYVWDRVAGTRRVLSNTETGGDLNAAITGVQLSGDGTTLALTTTATNARASVTDSSITDVYTVPVAGGPLIRLTGDQQTSVATGITRDGTEVSIGTAAPLVAADTDTASSLYVLDVATGAAELGSPHPINGDTTGGGTVSSDGSAVVFLASGAVTDTGGNTSTNRVYHVDRATGTVTRASHDGRGGRSGHVQNFDISGDGRRVAFSVRDPDTVDAANLRASTNTQMGTFVSDVATGRVEGVDVSTLDPPGTPGTSWVALSDSGDEAAVLTTERLVAADQAATGDVYLWTRSAAFTITGTPPAPVVGAPYSFTFGTHGATGPFTWAVHSGSLPSGLALSSAGVLSGTPDPVGPSTFTVRASTAGGRSAYGTYTVTTSAPLVVTSTTLPEGRINSPYSQFLTATGGSTPYTWSLVQGPLPTGLSLNGSIGRISGTPTVAGSYPLVVRVTDSIGRTTDQAITLTINQTLVVPAQTLPPLVLDQPFTYTFTSTGGGSSKTWTVSFGTLPAGLSLSSAGVLSGTPTVAGVRQVTIRVADTAGASATRVFDLSVTSLVASVTAPPATSEGDAGTHDVTFTAHLSAASTQEVTIPWSTVEGTATAGSDFVAASGSVVFPAGTTAVPFTVAVKGDRTFEATEMFRVDLGSPSPASVVVPDPSAHATILNDDIDPGPTWRDTSAFSVSDARVVEGGTAQVTISRTGNNSEVASVKWATANSTAVAPGDFTKVSATTQSFLPGQQTKVVTVPTVASPGSLATDRSFSVVLSGPSNADLADALGVVTILDAGTDPAWYAIRDTSVAEGQVATVTIVRGGDTSLAATVQVSTQNSSAQAGRDFVGLAPTVIAFAAGESAQTVSVGTIGDAVDLTANRVFRLLLGSATNGRPSDSLATVTIVDDEGTPIAPPSTFVSVDPVRVTEGGVATVRVRRRGNLAGTSTVKVATGTGASPWGPAAGAGSDFDAVALTTVTFGPGVDHVDVPVTTKPDTEAELDEAIPVNLTAATGGATIEAAQSFVTIRDDDFGLAPPSVSVTDVRVLEDHPAVFRVTRAGDTTVPVTVSWATGDETAVAGDDYVASPVAAPVTIPAGQTEVTVSVPTVRDDVSEPNETFRITLSAPSAGATIADAVGQAQVTDSGWEPPAYLVGDTNVAEGGVATFTVTRTGDRTQAGSVTVATANGTGSAPADHTAKPATVVAFAPGEATRSVTVQTAQNAVDVAANKTFKLVITASTNGAVWDAEAVATIVDDEGAPVAAPQTWFSIDDQRVAEGGTITLTVTRRGDTSGTSTVQVKSVNITATAGVDHNTVAPTTLTFDPGETTRTVTVTIRTDTVPERHETFALDLSAAVGAVIEDARGTITIHDND
jgi:hypothetical protein